MLAAAFAHAMSRSVNRVGNVIRQTDFISLTGARIRISSQPRHAHTHDASAAIMSQKSPPVDMTRSFITGDDTGRYYAAYFGRNIHVAMKYLALPQRPWCLATAAAADIITALSPYGGCGDRWPRAASGAEAFVPSGSLSLTRHGLAPRAVASIFIAALADGHCAER